MVVKFIIITRCALIGIGFGCRIKATPTENIVSLEYTGVGSVGRHIFINIL